MRTGEDKSKKRAPRNRTIDISENETAKLRKRILFENAFSPGSSITDRTICGDVFRLLPLLPDKSFDLIFADPPYNLSKDFGVEKFRETTPEKYEKWLDLWLGNCRRILKDSGSIYICGDWRSSSAIHRAGMKYFIPRNRITWEREKGRGAKTNWKNASEDIWFFTVSERYVFNLEAVKTRRRVLAPYTEKGAPKDWQQTDQGKFRLTHPSNFWTDLTVPFWSMPENTDHPTQKPEKLLAKILLASTNDGDLVFDPFAGSGTTAATAKKLGRNYCGIEIDENFCLLAEKRVEMAKRDDTIQGFSDGVFWERNARPQPDR